MPNKQTKVMQRKQEATESNHCSIKLDIEIYAATVVYKSVRPALPQSRSGWGTDGLNIGDVYGAPRNPVCQPSPASQLCKNAHVEWSRNHQFFLLARRHATTEFGSVIP
jgi:hypothetical protein